MKVSISVLNLKKRPKKRRGRPKDDQLTDMIWEVWKETRNVREAARELGMREGRVAYHIKKKRNNMEKK